MRKSISPQNKSEVFPITAMQRKDALNVRMCVDRKSVYVFYKFAYIYIYLYVSKQVHIACDIMILTLPWLRARDSYADNGILQSVSGIQSVCTVCTICTVCPARSARRQTGVCVACVLSVCF